MIIANKVYWTIFRLSQNLVYSFLICGINFLYLPLLSADNIADMNENSRKNKVREFCEQNPLDSKCHNYLDSEFRLHKDAEKETKEDRQERYSEQRYRRQRQRELISFCREMPDSVRCQELK